MEPNQPQAQPPRRVRLVQWVRWLLKATIWYGLTALLDRVGFTPQTVQVLCVDPDANKLLLLRSREYRSGWSLVQGLRRGTRSFGLGPVCADVREDARRELAREAIPKPPPLADFRIAERYREGPFQQFDCTVLVVFCTPDGVTLGPETGAGAPCWLPLAEALDLLKNKVLRELFADWRDDPAANPAAPAEEHRRRFLMGPPDAASVAQAQQAPVGALDRLWPMPLLMLETARALGARRFDEVYQADRDYAGQLWSAMSVDARDCYRPDPRLWRDCRFLDTRRVGDLLGGWLDARIDRVAGDSDNAQARSTPGWMSPDTALRFQARSGCELSLDLIYDARDDRVGCFVSSGGMGGAMSDVLLYALMSERYLPIPVFHTHRTYRTRVGYKQASPVDYWAMGSLYYRLNGAPVGDCVFFPDGTWTEYGVTGHGRCVFRRAGDALLPPDGEPVTTFIDISLPERPRRGGA
ncbi:MAG: hypothetical protein PVG09_03630 [Thiohalocapsa sp.]|jgi:hypothetical protein